jgi:hypothetical protein
MKYFVFLISLSCLLVSLDCQADKIIWSGEVNANGAPTESISLVLQQQYQIKVSGYVNLGKWIQHREKLASDACYEFSQNHPFKKLTSIRNSLDISMCEGPYHPDHVYRSDIFTANQNRIHFWVYDTYYEDNGGSFHVEIINILDELPLLNKDKPVD